MPDFGKPLGYSVPGMDAVHVRGDLIYKIADGAQLKMDVYLPPALPAGEYAPVVFFVHGGCLPRDLPVQPKDWGVYQSYGRIAAASGFVGVTFNHRYWGWSRADMERSFGDVLDAVRFFREQDAAHGADPEHAALWAFSGSGPHLGLATSARLDFVRCLVAFYVLFDIELQARQLSIDPDAERLADFSLTRRLEDDASAFPPIFIGRAGLDAPPINESADRFIAKALARNVTLDVANHAAGRHGFDIYDDDARAREIITRAVDFVRAHIRT